jgi:GR25 family glycosyltransferase involved in LPS biosynthesis
VIPICISTVNGKGLPVLLESIKQYAPEAFVYLRGTERVVSGYKNARLIFGEPRNFGDDYNEVIDDALKYAQACIVCNDDVVLTPNSYQRLLEDVEVIRELEVNVGWVGARSDYVRPAQNIRYNPDGDHLEMCRFKSEQFIRHANSIAPIFAYISRDAWHHGRFPPLNWFSDDVSCADLNNQGYQHFVSSAYVHHIGSQTTGDDSKQLVAASVPWVKEHRPQYVKHFFGS